MKIRLILFLTLIIGFVTLGSAVSSRASVVTLTFDGLKDREQILDYYNGGTGGSGSGPGPNYGITFGADGLAVNSGSYANNPSPPGVLSF